MQEMNHKMEGNEAIHGNIKCGDQVKSTVGVTEDQEEEKTSGTSMSGRTSGHTAYQQLLHIIPDTLYKSPEAPFTTE